MTPTSVELVWAWVAAGDIEQIEVRTAGGELCFTLPPISKSVMTPALREKHERNARTFAAAPLLLALVKAALQWGASTGWQGKANAAVDKVERPKPSGPHAAT